MIMGMRAVCPHGSPRLLCTDEPHDLKRHAQEFKAMLKAGFTIEIGDLDDFTQTYKWCPETPCKLVPKGSRPLITDAS